MLISQVVGKNGEADGKESNKIFFHFEQEGTSPTAIWTMCETTLKKKIFLIICECLRLWATDQKVTRSNLSIADLPLFLNKTLDPQYCIALVVLYLFSVGYKKTTTTTQYSKKLMLKKRKSAFSAKGWTSLTSPTQLVFLGQYQLGKPFQMLL